MDTEEFPPLPILLDETGGGAIADQTSGAICSVSSRVGTVQGATCPVPNDLDVTLAEPGTRFVQDDQDGDPAVRPLADGDEGHTVVVCFAGTSLDVKNGEYDLVACQTATQEPELRRRARRRRQLPAPGRRPDRPPH